MLSGTFAPTRSACRDARSPATRSRRSAPTAPARLIRPIRGNMQMKGIDLVATPSHRIVEFGIARVPENRRLFQRMTVGITSAWAGTG
jgi:hypothetical protein